MLSNMRRVVSSSLSFGAKRAGFTSRFAGVTATQTSSSSSSNMFFSSLFLQKKYQENNNPTNNPTNQTMLSNMRRVVSSSLSFGAKRAGFTSRFAGVTATQTTTSSSSNMFFSSDNTVPGTEDKLSTTTVGKSTNIRFHESTVPREVREELMNQRGCILWMTGLSGSGKSTVAYTLERALIDAGKIAYVLDGDNIRTGLNSNVGFSAEDRAENIRRVSELAKLFADAGVITIVSFISPYQKDRQLARNINAPGDARFIEVFMDIPIDVCEQRDPKGLYVKARAGLIKGFTGIDDPYEAPENPEIKVTVKDENGEYNTPESMAEHLYEYLNLGGFLGPVRNMPWDGK